MKDTFLRASYVVNQNIILVALVGFLHVSFFSGAMAYVAVVGFVIAFFLQIIISGRIVGRLRNQKAQKPRVIVKQNWLNYLVAFLVLAIPPLLVTQLIETLPISAHQFVISKEGIKAGVWLITMYVFPIVFLKKEGWMSVVAGIVYFFANLRQSALIAPYVVLMFALNVGGLLWSLRQIQENAGLLHFVPAMMVITIISTYLSFIVFAAATNVLVAGQRSGIERGA